MNITMGKVDFLLSPAVDNQETLKDNIPNLIEYYIKGHNIGSTKVKSDFVVKEDVMVERISGVLLPKVSEATSKKEILQNTQDVTDLYPDSKEVLTDILSTNNEGNTGEIQALGIVGVMVLIFLVGVANGVRDKRKTTP